MPIKQKLVCACALLGLLAGQGLHAQNKELVDYVIPTLAISVICWFLPLQPCSCRTACCVCIPSEVIILRNW